MKNEKMLLVGAATVAIAAAAILYIRKKEELSNDYPKRAPQLDIENPGSQDDFPKPPMESAMG